MKVTIKITKDFKKAIKPLLKKYPSLSNDLLLLQTELYINPKLGTPLGKGVYKIRLKITKLFFLSISFNFFDDHLLFFQFNSFFY